MIVAMLFFASVILFGTQASGQSVQTTNLMLAVSNPKYADILKMGGSLRYAPISELLRSRERYAAVTRLVDYLQDSNESVRGGAWDLLTIIQPDTPGSEDEYGKWKKWLDRLKSPIETRSYGDALLDIDIIRARFDDRHRHGGVWPLSSKDIKESTQYYRDVIGLLEYFKYPSQRIRDYANITLLTEQPSCPGDWEGWLKRVEAGEFDKPSPSK